MVNQKIQLLNYPVYIGKDLFSDKEILQQHISGHQVLIVTQKNIARHYLPALQLPLKNFQCDEIFLLDGEPHKNLSEWQKILDRLLLRQHERSTTLIALGGGVVGDMTGFAAACYLRGVNYIQIATTLIAQVDSALGGKTGVNHAGEKNKIGVFYQPVCVIADIAVLQTLPEREYAAGLAEVIKYALIWDAAFFVWLEENISALLSRDSDALLIAVRKSVEIKAAIVGLDEREQHVRALLNFGHTFGHALEAANDFKRILHGEAVAVGMMIAVQLSVDLGWLKEEEARRVFLLLEKIGVGGYQFDFPEVEKFVGLMQGDKKVAAGRVNLILLKGIGVAVKTDEVSSELVKNAIGIFMNNLIVEA